MKNITSIILSGVLILCVMSCGVIDKFTVGGKDMKRTEDLWPDVPRMDDLTASELELPISVKFVMRTALNNLWRLDKDGEDKTPATGDWIAFTSRKTPVDVQGFYTNQRMTDFGGWEPSKNSTCVDGKDKGVDGVLCLFQKLANKKQVGLAIIAMADPDKKQTNVFLLRIESEPGRGDLAVRPSNANTTKARGAITDLKGPAPYGIEKRPMPTGSNLDQLLPKQVGSYTRVLLEKSDERGATPSSIQTDGNSVYATYRFGEKEIFIEFAINSRAEDSQAALEVAAGDAVGEFPEDPGKGSIGTEPSYLKVSGENGPFFAWTRGGYYFSANAKGGEADLDAFMNAFSY